MQNIDISKDELTRLIKQGLSIRLIAKDLDKSVYYVKRYLKFYGLKTKQSAHGLKCKQCSKPLTGIQQYYCSNECKSKFFVNKNSTEECHYQTLRGKKKKLDLIALKGSKCQICGYNKNYAALNFHHLDSTKKKFNLDIRMFSSKSLDKLKLEADKCILLCFNCHMELHNPQCNISHE